MAASIGNLPKAPQTFDTVHMRVPLSINSTSHGSSNGQLTLKRHQKFKLEPMKILQPSNKKLSLPESQRIMHILDELVKKIEIIEFIEVICNNEERLRKVIANNLNEDDKKKNYEEIFMSICKHHLTMIECYKNKQYNENNPQFTQKKETLEGLIKNSCKDILRVFHFKPNLLTSVKDEFLNQKKDVFVITQLKSIYYILNLFQI
jgi:hypothetical protein